MRILWISSLLINCWVGVVAQTPEQPFAHGDLPADWQGPYDVTQDNNGLFKVGFARVLKGDGGFGFLYEGGEITVEQTTKTLDEWKKDVYGHMNGTGRADSYQQCRCTRLGDGQTKVGGYTAYWVSELQQCYKKADGSFDDEDNVRAYYVQVGKAAYFIYTESDSETEGGTQAYERDIDYIINGFRFFGATNTDDNTNTNGGDDYTGSDEIVVDPGGTTDTGGGDDGWSVGEVVVGAIVGGGAAGAIGWGVRAAMKAKGSSGGNTPQRQPQVPQKGNTSRNRPPRRKEEPAPEDDPKPEDDNKDKEKEDKETKDDQTTRYILQLSKNKMEMGVGESDTLQVAVWRLGQDGSKQIAQEAQIELRAHSGALSLRPAQGTGSIQTQIALHSQPDNDTIWVDVLAQANGSAMRSRISVTVHKSAATYEFISIQMPPDKTELLPDGQDVWYLYTQVRNTTDAHDPELPKLTATISLKGTGMDNGWLDMGKQQMIDGWQAVGFKASNPQPHLTHPTQVVRPPRQVSIEASVPLPNGEVLRKLFDFPLQQPAVLDVDNDGIYFPALPPKVDVLRGGGAAKELKIDILAFIHDAVAGEHWSFSAEYKKGTPQLTAIEIIVQGDDRAIIRLKTPTHPLPDGTASLFGHLLVRAKSAKRAAFNERQVNVTLRGEGIFVLKGMTKGTLQIAGDPDNEPTTAEIAVYVWDAQRQEMVADRRAVEHLRFDLDTPNRTDKQAMNVLSVAKIKPEFDGTISDNHALFNLQVQQEIPGEDKLLPFVLRLITHSDIDGKDYELDVPAGILAQGIGPSSEDWQKEYDNCKKYIERHVPDKYKPDMTRLLEDRKMSLGHEGLYYLRHKIHSITQNLILAEGAEGYRDAEKWYTDMIELLEWCEWAGNLAFNAVAASLFGPYAPAVTIAKSYGIQALQYVLEGKTLEQWVYDSFTLHALFKAGEGRLIDVDKIAEYFKNDGTIKAYAKAWAIFIGYHFAYNVFWEKKSVVEGLKQVAREIRDEVIVAFFQKRLQTEATKGKDGMEPITDPIRKLRQGFVAKANGQHACQLDDVLACMRDPQAMRTLKKASPELQDAFNRTREALYKEHDNTVKSQLSKDLGIPVEDLRIDDFRTPGGAGSTINTDRDYRMLYRAGKDANGNDVWFEVPKEKWQDTSYQTFGQLTGKPAGMSDLEWAQRHLQLATDKAHIEASPDYSDHAIDPTTGQKVIIRPNIIAVEEGASRLFDSTALGNMYHEKVHASLRMGQLSEAIAQCKKGVDTLQKVRHGYDIQQLSIGKLPQSLQDGMELIRRAPTDQSATPAVMAKFNQDLQQAGFHSLEDFSNKLAAQFESLKKYDQQPTAKR